MAAERRQFDPRRDFEGVSRFLVGLCRPGNRDGNWLQPIWEYAYTHPWFDDAAVRHVGIWEDAGRIVAVATYELKLGEPPEDADEGRRKMQSGPNFRPELTIVAVAPNGEFVSYAGLGYESTDRYAYVEPVATDPDYRRRGLASACVLEGIRRCGALGAEIAYVGTDKPLYLSLGFRPQFVTRRWRKRLVE